MGTSRTYSVNKSYLYLYSQVVLMCFISLLESIGKRQNKVNVCLFRNAIPFTDSNTLHLSAICYRNNKNYPPRIHAHVLIVDIH